MDNDDKPILWYFADPMCSWCWGFSPVISEIKKSYHHHGKEAPLYFWRDQHGHEVDLVVDKGNNLFCIEILKILTTIKLENLFG